VAQVGHCQFDDGMYWLLPVFSDFLSPRLNTSFYWLASLILIKQNSTHFKVKKREDENLRDVFSRHVSAYNPLHQNKRERKKRTFDFSTLGPDVAQD